jgi:hypothetical protein
LQGGHYFSKQDGALRIGVSGVLQDRCFHLGAVGVFVLGKERQNCHSALVMAPQDWVSGTCMFNHPLKVSGEFRE